MWYQLEGMIILDFEKAWKEMEDKYGIKDHLAIKYLYAKREIWIMAYFKGLYCGRMTSI
jgi:hypothetical protein